MSSRRFPGKVLASLSGRPVVARVIASVAKVVPARRIVVATSVEASDDPLAAYVRTLGVEVFRGPLDDVVGRFRMCLEKHPCDWFFRICADSPLLDPRIMAAMAPLSGRGDVDIVTNVFPRTFPKGQSAEMLRAGTFRKVAARRLTRYEREHVTPVYYGHPRAFRILNVASGRPSWSATRMDVSTPEDLGRLERLYPGGARDLPRWRPAVGGGR